MATTKTFSKRLVGAYVLDWLVIMLVSLLNSSYELITWPLPTRLIVQHLHLLTCHSAIAAIGGGLNFITPYKRPFSLLDLSISFPFHPETISITTVGLVSIVGPGFIIAVVCNGVYSGSERKRGNQCIRVGITMSSTLIKIGYEQ